jgi:hypothetical protein
VGREIMGGGRAGVRKIKKSNMWVPRLVVGIVERYRGWMVAGELDIEERILIVRIEYYF